MPWRGPSQPGEFPTLGFLISDFIREHCVVPDGEYAGQPFTLSDDQLLFLLWFYRLHPAAEPDLTKPSRPFVFNRGGQLVQPQKWGKGPFSAAVICAEAQGPVLFDGWDANGEPVGRPWATPWIQVTAASEAQTDNVWRALVPMIELGNLHADIPDTGETRINLPNRGKIEPVTSSARSRLGQRITHASQDEGHNWLPRNGGRKLADNQRRNLAGMGGRFLETGNAWNPAERSVAQDTWESAAAGVFKMMGEAGPGSIRSRRDRDRMLKQLYGKSWWVDRERISAEIDDLLERGEVAQAERYFLNRIVPGEDRAFDQTRWRQLADPEHRVPNDALIAVGVDGARYFDALAVVATEVDTGFQWPLGVWERPELAADDYEHPLEEVDEVLTDAFSRFDVWRVYVDPGSQYANISTLLEKWQGRWGDKRVLAWTMSRLRPTALMVRNYAGAIVTGDLSHDGDAVHARHVANARRRSITALDDDGKPLWVISKEAPASPLKIDAAAAGALSWEARGDAIAAGAAASRRRRSVYEDRGLMTV